MRVLSAVLLSIIVTSTFADTSVDGEKSTLVRPVASNVIEFRFEERCAGIVSSTADGKPFRPQMSFMDRSAFIRRDESGPEKKASRSGPCSSAEFAALEGQALVDALADSGSCIDVLWNFDDDVATVLAPATITSAAGTIVSESSNLVLHATRLERLALLYQIAFYHEYYEEAIDYDSATVDSAQQAIVAIGRSPEFFDDDEVLIDLRSQWALSTDNTNSAHLVIGVLETILERFLASPALAEVYGERGTVYRSMSAMNRAIFNEHVQHGTDSLWYDLVPDELLGALGTFALDLDYSDLTEFLVNTAIYTLGHFAYLNPTSASEAHQDLSTAYETHPGYTGPWFRTVVDLDYFFDGTLIDGTQLDYEQLRAEVMSVALPSQDVFDDGQLVFQTAVPRETVEELYDAIQEVESQFFRKTTLLDPVEGDPNETLTLVIYGSLDDYQLYQPFLFGLGTNNGGIFIEEWGMLFTYERTPDESIYTLEELLRHEYVHFLDSRYVVVPSFGAGIYAGGRLSWYSEGLAEFLVGSTRTVGVLPRRILLERIDGDATRMSVGQIVTADYGSYRFYRYAGMLFEFMASQRPELLTKLFDFVRADDPAELDALFAAMASDHDLEQAFQAYLDTLIEQLDSGDGAFAEDNPTTPTPDGLPVGNTEQILQTLHAEMPTASGGFEVWPHRFQYSDVMSLELRASAVVPREFLDAEMDRRLMVLTSRAPNFASAVAWFGNFEVTGTTVTATYVVEGPFFETVPDDGDGVSANNGDGVYTPCRGGQTVDCDDNCPWEANPTQSDSDSDGVGDACDTNPVLQVSSDPADGTAFGSIQAAVEAAPESGTRIEIHAGLGPYAETVVLDRGQVFTLVGLGNPAELPVIIDGGFGPAFRLTSTTGTSPMRFENLSLHGNQGIDTLVSTELTDITFELIAEEALLLRRGTHRLSRSKVLSSRVGAHVDTDARLTMDRVQIRGMSDAGVVADGRVRAVSSLIADGAGADGIRLGPSGVLDLVYSTIVNNSGYGIDNIEGGTPTIDKSIVYANAGGDLANVDCSSVSWSDVGTSDCSDVGGNLSTDPLLGVDYRLTDGSPCLDHGEHHLDFNGEPGRDFLDGPRLRDHDGDGYAQDDCGALEAIPDDPTTAAVTDLRWETSTRLSWTTHLAADAYHVYRQNLNQLSFQDYGRCFTSANLTSIQDLQDPEPSEGLFYVVSAEQAGDESSLGVGSLVERSNFFPCVSARNLRGQPGLRRTSPGASASRKGLHTR